MGVTSLDQKPGSDTDVTSSARKTLIYVSSRIWLAKGGTKQNNSFISLIENS